MLLLSFKISAGSPIPRTQDPGSLVGCLQEALSVLIYPKHPSLCQSSPADPLLEPHRVTYHLRDRSYSCTHCSLKETCFFPTSSGNLLVFNIYSAPVSTILKPLWTLWTKWPASAVFDVLPLEHGSHYIRVVCTHTIIHFVPPNNSPASHILSPNINQTPPTWVRTRASSCPWAHSSLTRL